MSCSWISKAKGTIFKYFEAQLILKWAFIFQSAASFHLAKGCYFSEKV